MAEALVAEGTDVVFGLMGGDNDNLIHRLVELGVRYVPVRHEQGAVGMADGYSRATRRPGVATVTLGPGVTNAATPMTAAYLSGSQVLVLIGDKRPGDGYDDRFGNMMIEHHPLLAATVHNYVELSAARHIGREMQGVFRALRRGRGPIAINTPWPALDAEEVPEGWTYVPSEVAAPPAPCVQPDPAMVATLAGWLDEAERPVLIGGLGALRAGGGPAISVLASRCGALLATSLAAKGLFSGEPFDFGVSGGFALEDARAVLAEADLVIGFGASLNSYTLDRGRLYERARIVRVENDPDRLAEVDDDVSLAVLGDARVVAEQLAGATAAKMGWRTDATRRAAADLDGWRGVTFSSPPDRMDPRLVSKIANEILPAERQVVIDIGQFMAVPAMHIDVTSAGDLLLPWRLGAIGQTLPVAVGAAVGRPDALTVLFIGDGGLMTTLAELETAVRCSIPLLVFVIDDGGYGAERYACVISGREPDLVDFDNPDFSEVAAAMGLQSVKVTSPDQLEKVLPELLPVTRPTLVHAIVDRDVYSTELFRLQANFRGREG
jgi:thiamine pyrophosphate-dependent acetolactate synthase large subunit-like protein